MKSELRVTRTNVFISEVYPDIETTSKELANVIEWADEMPVAYRVVRTSKSKTFGKGSSTHIGWAQTGDGPDVVLERLKTLKEACMQPTEFWSQRARFALEHFDEPGFRGGFFQQHSIWTDGVEYPRACAHLDFTEETLKEVLDRFGRWMDSGYFYSNTTRITIDGETCRTFGVEERIARNNLEIVKSRGWAGTLLKNQILSKKNVKPKKVKKLEKRSA